jgi:pyruvate/2-oxoacid:ferredoxin oxidoreductase beta subunit
MLSLVIRMALKVLGPNTVMTVPACCNAVIQGYYPKSSSAVPTLNTAFAAAAATASGMSAALELSGRGETSVVAWAGDGGTADIGIQGLSGAAERGENFIYVCYDNEAYMNTARRAAAPPRRARRRPRP